MHSPVIDWPYATLSEATGAASPKPRAGHPPLKDRPVPAALYKKMVAALRQEFAQGRLQATFSDATQAVNPLLSGYRGDITGAALVLVASVTAEARLLRMLAQGQHLGPRGPEPLLGVARTALARVSGAEHNVMLRSAALGASFAKIIRQLRLKSRLAAPDCARLLRAKDTLVQRIQAEATSLMDRIGGAHGGSVGPGTSADFEQMKRSLGGGLNYAALLHGRGFTDAAAHVVNTLHALAPAAVPNNASPTDYRRLSSTTRVHAGNADGPLLHALGVRQGNPASGDELAAYLRLGELVARPRPAVTAPWKFSLALAQHNDNTAGLRDGIARSDDGPTATNAIEATWKRTGERWVLNIDQALFTERGGMHRTDLMQLSVQHLKHKRGRMFFDTVTGGWLVGVQGTGDFGGDRVQDGWHSLTGSMLGGRRLGDGLQDTYATPRQLALLLGAEVQGSKRVGLFEFGAGGQATAPVGATGLGQVSTNVGVRAGKTSGPYASIGAKGGVQWTTGAAMDFDGAPRDGFFVSPRVALGWEFGSWSLGLEWQGNRFATQSGRGNRDGESVSLTVRFGP